MSTYFVRHCITSFVMASNLGLKGYLQSPVRLLLLSVLQTEQKKLSYRAGI